MELRAGGAQTYPKFHKEDSGGGGEGGEELECDRADQGSRGGHPRCFVHSLQGVSIN